MIYKITIKAFMLIGAGFIGSAISGMYTGDPYTAKLLFAGAFIGFALMLTKKNYE